MRNAILPERILFRRIRLPILAALMVIAFGAAGARAQTITASLEGVVRDASKAVIPGGNVLVRNTATNARVSLTTDGDGRFIAPSLQPGPYAVRVEAPGFKTLERTGLVLYVAQSVRIDLIMDVGQVTETLEVTAAAPLLESTTSAIGHAVSNKSIVDLPLNQRNPYALVLLVPGATGGVGSQFNQINFRVNGGRPGTNEILLDGVPSSPPLVNSIQGFSVFPSVDAVQEFRVQANNYSAEFGRSGGSVVNLIYKSGGNDLHGSVFEFLRNSRLDANNFFANSRGVPLGSFKRNQFGASLGGPVYIPKLYNGRNKTFFYGTYEGLRERSAANFITTVPTPMRRSGDFSGTRYTDGRLITIYDPVTTTRVGSGFVRAPFAGNLIPASRIDPVARNVSKYYPAANRPGDPFTQTRNFAASGANVTDSNQADVKLDQIVNDFNRFFVRFSRRRLSIPPADFFPKEFLIAQGGFFQPQTGTGATFDYTLNVAPTYLVNFRYGLGRVLLDFRPRSDGFDPTQLELPAYIRANADRLMFPGFSPAGYTALGNGGAEFRRNAFETHSWMVSNTKIMEKHLLKFGADIRWLRVNNMEAGQASGQFNFARSFTQGPDPTRATATAGDGMASFLLGLGSGAMTKAWQGAAVRSTYWAEYFQDDWKATSKLTVNLGLRYELETPRIERFNRMNYFDTGAPSPLARPSGLTDLRGGLVFVAVDGRGRRQFGTDTRNWAPRIGLAYQAAANTVLRAAYGVFYAPSYKGAVGAAGNFGFRTDTQYVGSLDGVTPLNYLRNPFPDGIAPVTGSSEGLLTLVGQRMQAPLSDTDQPYMQQWNFNIQRQLPGSILVDAAYVGSRGLHLAESFVSDYNLNQLRPEQLALGAQLLDPVANPFSGLITRGPLSGKTVPRGYLLSAYPQFDGVFVQFKTGASSTYHAFQLKVEKRFGTGLSFMLSYTGAKLIDDSSAVGIGSNVYRQNIYDRRADRSVSVEDIAQRFVLSYIYQIPFGRGRKLGGGWSSPVDSILGGWQINGITTFQSGQPLAITAPNTSNSGNTTLRPNNNGTSAKRSGSVSSRLNRYFDTTAFSQPAPFTFGNAGRVLPDVRAPGIRSFDASLFKHFRFSEHMTLEFRAEFFNLFNTPRFGGPNQSLNSPLFGVISSQANDPRQVQFGLKLLL
ncbi:MAG: TonB-dependent receptor [Acidobacteria bacterium]|nr:TonB-dependent receptor [Acidobacteriota bacterium]